MEDTTGTVTAQPDAPLMRVHQAHEELRAAAFAVIERGDFGAHSALFEEWERVARMVEQVRDLNDRKINAFMETEAVDQVIRESQEEG